MAFYKSIRRLARNITQDLRYGGFLGGVKQSPYAGAGAYDTANSDYEALAHLFAPLRDRIREHSVLVDVGCGKGRVLNFWLREFPDRQVCGIELDESVAADTARRLSSYPRVRVLQGDVRELIPPEATFFYLFNPFNREVLADFVARLKASPQALQGRQIDILYYNPLHADVFEASDAVITAVSLPQGFHRALYIRLSESR